MSRRFKIKMVIYFLYGALISSSLFLPWLVSVLLASILIYNGRYIVPFVVAILFDLVYVGNTLKVFPFAFAFTTFVVGMTLVVYLIKRFTWSR